MLLTAGAVVLIPNAPLVTITMFVQVVAVTLLPSAPASSCCSCSTTRGTMGEHVNTRWQNIANWTIVVLVIVMSTVLGITTLFPTLLE